MKYLIVFLLLFLTGCASVYNSDSPRVSVIEYGTSGIGSYVSGSVGGCEIMIHKAKELGNSTVQYTGDKCTVSVKSE